MANFKVGDRVVHHKYGGGVIKRDDTSSTPYYVVLDEAIDGGFGTLDSRHGWWCYASDLAPENTTNTIEKPKAGAPAIVALIENDKPRPNKKPYVHDTTEAATKEAERLAGKYPGQKFGVYQLVTARIGTVSVVEA